MDVEWGPLPFDEAIDFFKDKVPMTMDEFMNLAKESRIRAFSVSNMTGIDALTDVQKSITKAIEEGMSFGDWKKIIGDTLLGYGIEGARSKLIFDTNVRVAYSAGHYQQMIDPDVLEERPYWRYVPSHAREPREEHIPWYNLVLPADDPWWDTHYPPNGWGCT